MFKLLPLLICTLFLYSCTVPADKDTIEKHKTEILSTEKQFEQTVKEKGISFGFYTFADENAVIKAKDTLIRGRLAIKKYYDGRTMKNEKLEWTPDFVEVSSSGDLGYTYGRYTFSATDTSGKEINNKGIFHTVWKKQKDGTWKFVWD